METEIWLAFLMAFAISMVLYPGTISLLRRLKAGQIISQDGPQTHLTKQGTPTMGGILIVMVSSLVALLTVILGSRPFGEHMLFGAFDGYIETTFVPLLLLFLAFAGLGFLDDYLIVKRGKSLGLRAREKLLGQFIIAAAFIGWQAHVYAGNPFIGALQMGKGRVVDLGALYHPLAVLYIVGFSNAVNIADGLDGLVGGVSAITAVALAVWAASMGGFNTLTAVLCFAIAGACAAFLWFNANPAKVFMGDTGSLALGAVFAGVAVVTMQEIPLLIYGLVLIVEIGSVVIQSGYFKYTRRKYGEGRRIFRMSPLHHHFELAGWPEQLVVSRFWIASAVCSVIGLLGRFWGIW